MNPIDPLQLQRLVDGELDNAETQELLRQAEQTPEQWQEIATGFVENQIWNRAFQAKPKPAPTTDSKFDSNLQAAFEPETTQHDFNPANQSSTHRSNQSNFSWWVMAASILAAVSIGYMASQIQNGSVASVNPVSSDGMAANSNLPDVRNLQSNGLRNELVNPVQSKITPAKLDAPYHLEVPENSEQFGKLPSGSTTVPLFTISNQAQLDELRKKQQSEPIIPPKILKQLMGSGYQFQQDIKFISGKLGDGRSFVVPVRTIRLLPGQ